MSNNQEEVNIISSEIISKNRKISGIFLSPEVKHGLSLFSEEEIEEIEKLITIDEGKARIKCQIKNKIKVAKPEEIVRQLWIYKLIHEFGYPKERIDIERVIYFGSRDSGLADIVILHEDLEHPYIITEVKRPKRSDGLEQLKSYCNADGAPIGLWSNGNEIIRLHREEPNIFVEIPRIPKVTEDLRDILTERWTIEWLIENDELKKGTTTLKKIILDLEELVLGNAGVEAFDEIFKLIYSKLYDEWMGINNENYQLEFFVGDRNPEQVKTAISNLLTGAKRQWPGVFEPTEKIELDDNHLKVCVSFIEKIKLFNSNLRIIDEAFEFLIPQVAKKKEGQFFTPRDVEDMIVEMINPKPNEFIIDPACGSAGFLLHSVMWVGGEAITGKELPVSAKNFAQNNITGIDFSKKAVKIAKAINLIAGDGKSQIFKDNSLSPHSWKADTKSGLNSRLIEYGDENFMNFDFDILITNPPFAGTIKERDILRLYQLAERNGKTVKQIGRHILFLERSLQFLRPGGRMAIVIPQGLISNPSTHNIREFIFNNARVLAVVGLHEFTFKPHTGTKTSVLFLQKYTEEEIGNREKIKAICEEKWDEYLDETKIKYKNIRWHDQIAYDDLDEILRNFIENTFDMAEEVDVNITNEENICDNEDESITTLINNLRELEEVLREKSEELETTSNEKQIQRQIKTLKNKIRGLNLKISKKTLAGQVYLSLNIKETRDKFQKYWIEYNVTEKLKYPIFFAINQKPIKLSNGEYRFKKDSDGNFILDQNNYLVIDHDLNEISKEFIKFAKEQKFDFW